MTIESFLFGKDAGGLIVKIRRDEHINKQKWYSGDVHNPRFEIEIAEAVRDAYGERSHLYALEAKMNSKTEEEINLWDAVLKQLDKE